MSDPVQTTTARMPRKEFRNIGIADLRHYRLPLPGLLSILHRISGLLLFIALPFLAYLLKESLTSESTYYYMTGILSHPIIKLIVWGLAWAFLHHMCAGVRHLFLDAHIGLAKKSAQRSSVIVFIVSIGLTLAASILIW